jgi:hypothetical protein
MFVELQTTQPCVSVCVYVTMHTSAYFACFQHVDFRMSALLLRSIGALKWLHQRGYSNVKQLAAGMQDWRARGLPEAR